MNVLIKSGGPTGVGTVITTEDGTPIKMVTSAKIQLCVDRINTAQLEILSVSAEVSADAVFMVAHPFTGKLHQVESIRFADGTEWPAK